MAIAQNPVQHQQKNHVDFRYHFVRESLEKKAIKLKVFGNQIHDC